MSESSSNRRDDFKWFIDLPSRWEDNDAYGHINNVIYYSWFDTAVNRFLVDNQLLDYATVSYTHLRAHETLSYQV